MENYALSHKLAIPATLIAATALTHDLDRSRFVHLKSKRFSFYLKLKTLLI
jgi:hypothetical protein